MTVALETRLQATLTAAYCRYAKELTTSARHKLQDPAVCEDLVQDTFMKTWMYLVKGGRIEIMRAFLHRILNHLIIDEYRKHKSLSLDVLLEKGFEAGDNQTERLFNMLDGKAVLSSMKHLPRKYKEVMRMRYVKGLSLGEVSRVSGQSKNTVAVQMCRGLEKLRVLNRAV